MKDKNWGIAGIGMLGNAIVNQMGIKNVKLGVYHPNAVRAKRFVLDYPNCYVLRKEEIDDLDAFIVALPTPKIENFVHDLKSNGLSLKQPVFVNLATTYPTSKLEHQFPDMKWMGMKCMAHSEDLHKYGNGLFVTEESSQLAEEKRQVIDGFSLIGEVLFDEESVVEELNKLATYFGIKAIKELEHELRIKGFSPEYEKRALAAIAPEVMRSYVRGRLGHFAQQVAKEFDAETNIPK